MDFSHNKNRLTNRTMKSCQLAQAEQIDKMRNAAACSQAKGGKVINWINSIPSPFLALLE